MRVRVYQPSTAPARIVIPNARWRAEGESDADLLTRACAHAEAQDPTLAGLPTADVEDTDLPQERSRVVGEELHATRAQWRLQDGRVVIDQAVPAPTRPVGSGRGPGR